MFCTFTLIQSPYCNNFILEVTTTCSTTESEPVTTETNSGVIISQDQKFNVVSCFI